MKRQLKIIPIQVKEEKSFHRFVFVAPDTSPFYLTNFLADMSEPSYNLSIEIEKKYSPIIADGIIQDHPTKNVKDTFTFYDNIDPIQSGGVVGKKVVRNTNNIELIIPKQGILIVTIKSNDGALFSGVCVASGEVEVL